MRKDMEEKREKLGETRKTECIFTFCLGVYCVLRVRESVLGYVISSTTYLFYSPLTLKHKYKYPSFEFK